MSHDHDPLTEEEHTHGIVLYQFLQPRFEAYEGSGIRIMNGADMAMIVRALRSPAGARLFNRRFLGPRAEGRPASFDRLIADGAPGAEAEKVRLGRAALGWSRERLAERAGVAALTILNIENGKSGGRPETLEALRQALENAGVTFGDDAVSWSPEADGREPEPE